MKNILNLSIIAALAAFAALGCGGSTEIGSPTNTTTTNTATATAAKSKVAAATPTEANESLFSAIKNKDKAAVKQLLSKKSLEIIEAEAKSRNSTLDNVLDNQLFVNVTLPEKAESRNEKINGDRASLEALSDKGDWVPTNFVKEDGMWKVDMAS